MTPPKQKSIASRETVDAFYKAVYPEYTRLAMMSNGEEEVLRDATQTINELRQWVDDLHRGTYVNCVYCGHRYGPSKTTPVSVADVLKEHISRCPKHPMSKLAQQNKILLEIIHWAKRHGKMSHPGVDHDNWEDELDRHLGLIDTTTTPHEIHDRCPKCNCTMYHNVKLGWYCPECRLERAMKILTDVGENVQDGSDFGSSALLAVDIFLCEIK